MQVNNGAYRGDAGIVEENIDPAVSLHGRLNAGLDVLVEGSVALENHAFHILLGKVCFDFFEFLAHNVD